MNKRAGRQGGVDPATFGLRPNAQDDRAGPATSLRDAQDDMNKRAGRQEGWIISWSGYLAGLRSADFLSISAKAFSIASV